jgi:hypothetical protein
LATFWAIFHLRHPVTLLARQQIADEFFQHFSKPKTFNYQPQNWSLIDESPSFYLALGTPQCHWL